MASEDSAHDPGEDALGEVRAAARALNEALDSLTRSAADASAHAGRVAGTSTRAGRVAVAGSMNRAARSLSAAADKLGGAGTGSGRGRAGDTRRRLLEAAAEIFAAKGYEGASVADIASAAGFTKGAFYASFPSKKAIFLEVVSCRAEEACLDDTDLHPQPELGDFTVQDVLLQLETCLYAVRHEEARAVLVEEWRRSLEALTARVARSRGRDTPSQEDTETAFALSAVALLGAVVGAATSPEEMNPMFRGAWGRLLGAPDRDAERG